MKTLLLLVILVAAVSYIFAISPRGAGSAKFEDFLDTPRAGRKVLEDAEKLREGDVVEGDIRVSRGLLERTQASRSGRTKRGAVTMSAWKWTPTQENGKTIVKIPYTDGFADKSQSKYELNRAIAEMTDRTCVRFVSRNGETDYVHFKDSSGCSSDIGKVGGKQDVSISSSGCHYKGKILHEMMHLLGFYHEQSRSDRDRYVKYNSANVKSGYEGQFSIKSQDTQGLAYDLHSMLHYRKDQFSSGSGNTLEAIADKKIQLGNKNDFSATDIKRINKLYSCSEVNNAYRDYYVTVSTSSGWTTGTNEYVYIRLVGSSGVTSQWCDVATGGSTDDFEAGSTQNFFVACNDVGTIQQLEVKLVNNPNDWWDDAWTLAKVVIKDKISSSQMKTYVFGANDKSLNAGDSVTLSPSVSTQSLESGIW